MSMNGVPLPSEHGFPARLLVPGTYGMKNVKWVDTIEVVEYEVRGYWQQRGWSQAAIVKTMRRAAPCSSTRAVPQSFTRCCCA